VEVELAAREQQHVAHVGQVGVSWPRRSPCTMRRAQGYADQDKRQEQRTREEEDGEMCHAPVSAPERLGTNPSRGTRAQAGRLLLEPAGPSPRCFKLGFHTRRDEQASSTNQHVSEKRGAFDDFHPQSIMSTAENQI
jgi:hypothetical protein